MDLTKLCSVFYVGFLLVLLKVDVCDGIRCYFCVGQGCGDTFDFSNNVVSIDDCGSGQCTKIKNFGGTVVRACSPMRLVNDGCNELDEVTATCACSTDLCNHGNTQGVTMTTISLTTALCCVIVKLFS